MNTLKNPRTAYRVQGFTSIEARREHHEKGDTILIGHRSYGHFVLDAILSMEMAESLSKQLNQLLSQ
jgi:hypothetical protein